MAHDMSGTLLNKRQRVELIRGQLELERSSFITHWKELNDFILPRRGRFFVSDVNRGDRRSNKIIDSTATFSLRTLSSGMMSGVTSPARPWFRLTTPDPDLAEMSGVKEWLHNVTQRMNTVFLRSNLYNALPTLYTDLGLFGTAAMALVEDEDDVIRCYPFPIGSYAVGNDARLNVRVFSREFRMTARQVVERFSKRSAKGEIDWSNISTVCRNLYERGSTEAWIDVIHVIAPNEEYDGEKMESRYKKFTSCYFEKGEPVQDNKFLLQEGFDEFPILVPRWEVTGEDVWGTNCPAMTALGDIKQLQLGEKRSAQAIEKMVNPPMTGPTSLRNAKASLLPGDITYLDSREGQGGFRPVHEVQLRIGELEQKQQQVRERIQRAFFEDLFLMLAYSDRRQITAREIDERHEEKLLALGPVLEQLNQDLLDPLIDRTFAIMLRKGLLPPPPEELSGSPLRVEYISIMAQAQKMVGLAGLERFAGFAFQMAQVDPESMDKVDRDQLLTEYGDMTGVPPSVLVPNDEVALIRQARQQQMAQQQEAANLAEAAKGVKDLSQADTGGRNALTDMLTGAERPV